MTTQTQLRFTLTIAVALAAVSIVTPDLAFARYTPPQVPEVDPGTLSSAIALAVGGAAILRDKLRRR